MNNSKIIYGMIFLLIIINFILITVLMFTEIVIKPDLLRSTPNKSSALIGDESFEETKEFFLNLSKEKGSLYAYNFLLSNKLNPKVNTHLMGHVVGEQIYKQLGLAGMQYCTPDIQNACSHAIVIGYLLENGEDKLPEIKSVCKTAPGGHNAYLQCFHGLGHALMAYAEYDMEKALKLCNNSGDTSEELSCVGGAVMEIISGGLHNPNIWAKMRAIYLRRDNPLSPCNTDVVPDKVKPICYSFLTPYLLNFYNPKSIYEDSNVSSAFKLCYAIPTKDKVNRDSCFGGFGKEFAILAQEKNFGNNNDTAFKQTYNWCRLARFEEQIKNCINSALNSYYWGGENSYDDAVNFCKALDKKDLKKSCFETITVLVHRFKNEKNYINDFCKSIPAEYRQVCS